MEEFKHTQKYLIMGPRKIRTVVALIKKLSPMDAIDKLEFVKRGAALTLSKVIRAVVAQARLKGIDPKDLEFKEIQVGEGPRLKRGRAASRGRWAPYKKRMSHVRIVLGVVKSKEKETKEAVKEEKKVEKAKKEVKTKKKGVKNGTKS